MNMMKDMPRNDDECGWEQGCLVGGGGGGEGGGGEVTNVCCRECSWYL